ncbi:hypothetical protein GQ43DRAFT_478906 [Delitschia confertaspora ATCC 74209]|uniref:Uncharacterized protein n=1 Tax=Delitschia confertaspora ATCC 74209 TaxID=1513339 RepID=A0A9P4MS12_9PLEO|nr:hypothetical protein GQ43DRAFT_478906 [Delitschia confertaspora ATCC 74209]
MAAFAPLEGKLRKPLLRPAKPLTFELQNHSAVYLEDGQYLEGFMFLHRLLLSGNSISTTDRLHPAFIAPPQQLALASSLIVYPPITTKAKSTDRQKGADAALRYLRSLSSTIHPLSVNFLEAFVFSTEPMRRRRSATVSSDEDVAHERLHGVAANAQSLWNRAEDFWHIVGWAFNCSVAHKKRWGRWKLWLEAMLDLLEVEWTERSRLYWVKTSETDDSILTSSLLWRYISSKDPTSRATRRRIFRAILAIGEPQSRKEFPEIWHDETIERKPVEENREGPKTIDISNDDYGEYGVDEEEDITEDMSRIPTRAVRRTAQSKSYGALGEEMSEEQNNGDVEIRDTDHAVEKLGGIDAIWLRQRLLSLLARVADALPRRFTTLEDIYDLHTEFFCPLRTIHFGLLLSTSQLSPTAQIALNANLLLPLLSSRLTNFTVITPSQADLEQYFLPAGAATHSYAANAKISLVLETMFRLMMQIKSLQATTSLREAVETGIQARNILYANARRKKGNEHEEVQAKELMDLSNERLLGLLEILEIAAGKPAQARRATSSASDSLPLTSSLSSIMSSISSGESDQDPDKE